MAQQQSQRRRGPIKIASEIKHQTFHRLSHFEHVPLRWVSGIDMQMSTLKPGLHNVSVRTLNNDGPSPGELTFATYKTFKVDHKPCSTSSQFLIR